tara:strand:+ start:452 stop:1711 length:1260 start_codon:yes stop_codon:yes gene_type:complete
MAIFRDGVKIGNMDVRTGLSKKRVQGLLRKHKIIEDDKGRGKFARDSKGEVQVIRTLVGKTEGFQFPVNFKCTFRQPPAIEQPSLVKEAYVEKTNRLGREVSTNRDAKYGGPNKGQIKGGSLDWRTHIMNNSTKELFNKRWEAAQTSAKLIYPHSGISRERRPENLLDLYCSKVSIPEKSITTGLYRHYGDPFPFPQNVMYGAITTTFYCDGTMHIKNYFDAWMKLIYNDITGNFNYYDEYTGEFDVHTRTTVANYHTKLSNTSGWKPPSEKTRAEEISEGIKDFTKQVNDATGIDGPRGEDLGKGSVKMPLLDFRENYGVRVFECFPQNVGAIDLAHDATDSIATFDVTWAYRRWNPFKMGNIGNRSTINLSVGEFRNEKDGFPFLEDLPPELSGPLTGAVNQGINTGPLSKASNIVG